VKLPENRLSRRSFVAGSGIATSVARAGSANAGPEPEKLSENLYRLEDTCNVYLIRNGTGGVLIDFGSGRILHHLAALGVTHIDGILHTHHHRDQCQGDHFAVARGIPIAVPAYEEHLFTDVENFWRNRRVYHEGYETRNDYFTLAASIPVAARIPDYETFPFGGRPFAHHGSPSPPR
jgi:glyoxylase-like metal-dependent hydrolase (beta-lactamase superfamily II)